MSFLWPIFNGAIFDWQNTLEDLPQKTFFHCLVTLGNGDLFYSGGQGSSFFRDSYKYIMQDNQWDQMADMADIRSNHGCGTVKNSATGKEEVVVAGGTGRVPGGCCPAISTSEIYTVEDNAWRQGPALPRNLSGPTSLPYEDSFLIMGGYDGSSCSDSIYKVKFCDIYIYNFNACGGFSTLVPIFVICVGTKYRTRI